MKRNISLVKGTHDIHGAEMEKFEFIIEKFYSICRNFNFKSIQTPILEQQDLFSRTVGEQTDIVSKEMYSFLDKGEAYICLRPEATSSLARFAASNYQSGLLKLITHGPMFIRERPTDVILAPTVLIVARAEAILAPTENNVSYTHLTLPTSDLV